MVYTGRAYGLFWVIKYLIIGEILNLLWIAGITELYWGNVFLDKWVNAFLASNKGEGKHENKNKYKNINTARKNKAAVVNTTIVLIKGIEIIPLE